MSIVSQLIAAFKKGAGQDPEKVEYPPGTNSGSHTPQDDGREFRNPGAGSTGVGADGGVLPPVASTSTETQEPTEPLPPAEPGPIEGDGGGTPTLPSAPFDPAEIVFERAAGPAALTDGESRPDFGKPETSGLDEGAGFKADDAPVVEDPDAGGDAAASLKANLDPAFTRRLRFASEEEPAPLTLKDAGDYKAEGIDSASDGDQGDTGLAENRAILSDFNVTKSVDKGSPSLATEDSGESPIELGGRYKIEGVEPSIASSDPEEGGEVLRGIKVEGAYKVEGVEPSIASSDPEEGGEVLGGIKVEGAYKVEGFEPSIASSDPEEGGEVLGGIKVEGAYKVEGFEPSIASSDPEEGGKVLGGIKVEGGYKVEGFEPSIASSDPEEGGEVLGGIKVEGAYKVEGFEPSIASSDPEEGGELTTAPRGELEMASIEGADELESAESSSDERQRRPLTQVEQEGGDPPDDGEGPHLVRGTPGSPDEEDSDEGELVGLADRRGAGVSDPRDPVQISGAIDKDSIDKVAAEPVAGVKLEGDYKVGGLALAEDLDVTPIDDGGEVVGVSRPQTLVFKPGRMTLAEDPDDGGGGGGMATGRPEDYTPNSGDGQATGRPEDYTPDSGGGNTTGRPEDYTPNSGDGQATGRPEGNVPGSEAESGGEAERLLRPLPEFKVDDLSVAPIDDGGEVFSEVKFKIEPAYLKFGEYKVEPEPDGDLKVEGGIKFEGARLDDTQNVAGFAPSAGPPGAPIPYPAVEGDGDDLAESLVRKAGGGQQEFFKVKMEEVMVTSARPGGEPLDEQAGEAPVARGALGDIDGESQDKDHKVGVEFGRRTEVKDSHDRFSNVGSEEPQTVAELADADDDFESSSLLDLKPEPDVKEMLPGLAGELPDVAELEFDLDDDLDDTNESEL